MPAITNAGGGYDRRMKVVGALLVCSLGCGLTMTRGPDPRTPPDQRPTCTETMTAPKRDGVAAFVGMFALFGGLIALEADGDEDVAKPLAIGGAVVMAAAYVSGGIGYFRVKRCRRAIADFDARATVRTSP